MTQLKDIIDTDHFAQASGLVRRTLAWARVDAYNAHHTGLAEGSYDHYEWTEAVPRDSPAYMSPEKACLILRAVRHRAASVTEAQRLQALGEAIAAA